MDGMYLDSSTGLNFTPSDILQYPVQALARVGVARQLTVSSTAVNQTLASTVRRISMTATGAALRFAVTGTATATSHYLAQDERIDISVVQGTTISAIRNASADAVLEISELI